MVESELTAILGHRPIRDDEGDVVIRVGSTMVFLRTSTDAREVILFAAVVHDVAGRSRATEVLNDLNIEARWVKFQLVRDRVFVISSRCMLIPSSRHIWRRRSRSCPRSPTALTTSSPQSSTGERLKRARRAELSRSAGSDGSVVVGPSGPWPCSRAGSEWHNASQSDAPRQDDDDDRPGHRWPPTGQ